MNPFDSPNTDIRLKKNTNFWHNGIAVGFNAGPPVSKYNFSHFLGDFSYKNWSQYRFEKCLKMD